MKTEKELNIIRGKMESNTASKKEIKTFFLYVDTLEDLVKEASSEDFYGTEGWKHRIGWE